MHSAKRPPRQGSRCAGTAIRPAAAQQSIDRHTAGVLKHQRHAVVVVRQRDRSRRPVCVKFGLSANSCFKPLDAIERGFRRGNKQDRR